MWDKNLRIGVFLLFYELLFREVDYDDFKSKSVNLDFQNEIRGLAEIFQKIDLQELFSKSVIFYSKKEEYETSIKKFIKSWDKTFIVIKACLFTFCVEFQELNDITKFDQKLINSYLRLAQEYVGAENVSVVHALISNLSKI